MTPKQASKIIGCSPSHVRHLIRQGKITAKEDRDAAGNLVYDITHTEACRFRDAPTTEHRGFPRGQKRN